MFAALVKFAINEPEPRGHYSRTTLFLAGASGLTTTIVGIALVFFPAQQITSLWSYEIWMVGGTLFFIGLAAFFFFVYGSGKVAQPGSLPHLLFSFDGRIPRLQFWGYFIPYFLLYVGTFVLAAAEEGLRFLPLAYSLLMLYPTLAVNAKRCHDRGRSGWFMLITFIPIVGFWYLIEVGFLEGTAGDNQYGPDPYLGALA
jgi:uncharacterized membrane protein YhaH (DUF805 family)